MTILEITNGDDRSEWLAARTKYSTASESHCVVYGQHTREYEQLVAQKRGLAEPPDLGRNPYVQAGVHLEGGVLSWWNAWDDAVSDVRPNRGLHTRAGLGPVAATVDGLATCAISGPVVVEVKVTGPTGLDAAAWRRWQKKCTNWVDKGPPKRYWCQIQTQSLVHDVAGGYCVVLLGGNRLHTNWIPRDDAWLRDEYLPAVAEFWERVERG